MNSWFSVQEPLPPRSMGGFVLPRATIKCMSGVREPIYFKFWFTWFVITAIYLVLQITLFLDSVIVYWIGLFVPIGILAFVMLITHKSVLALIGIILVALSLFLADRLAPHFRVDSHWKKVVFNLIYLFFLTISVEFIIYGQWIALGLLTDWPPFQ